MSSLTEQERLGLEDVFLSISNNSSRHTEIPFYKTLKNSIAEKQHKIRKYYKSVSIFKKLKNSVKLLQFAHITHKNSKKKKNLS
ncbi:MAG: hypothetical protein U9P71_09830 [Campylobacterota bacterium]|nr:hypothetical protein [Campylobacterota bacterium]